MALIIAKGCFVIYSSSSILEGKPSKNSLWYESYRGFKPNSVVRKVKGYAN